MTAIQYSMYPTNIQAAMLLEKYGSSEAAGNALGVCRTSIGHWIKGDWEPNGPNKERLLSALQGKPVPVRTPTEPPAASPSNEPETAPQQEDTQADLLLLRVTKIVNRRDHSFGFADDVASGQTYFILSKVMKACPGLRKGMEFLAAVRPSNSDDEHAVVVHATI